LQRSAEEEKAREEEGKRDGNTEFTEIRAQGAKKQ